MINIADDFQPLGWDKGIQIKVDERGFEDAPQVLAMRPLINQVFSNIVENAVKYSKNDSTVQITGSYLQSADFVIVKISSKSIPLPDPPEKVFERGFRSEPARNKYPAGTGFGLYIARRIVEIHQGRIKAQMHNGDTVVFAVALSVKALEGKARVRESKDNPTS